MVFAQNVHIGTFLTNYRSLSEFYQFYYVSVEVGTSVFLKVFCETVFFQRSLKIQ